MAIEEKQFPICCPVCEELVVVRDLSLLVEDEEELEKLVEISLNNFLDQTKFWKPCFTVDCKGLCEEAEGVRGKSGGE